MSRTIQLLVALLCSASPLLAQSFGKNKVQYKDFEWRVLETPHFEILFYQGEATIVRDAAQLAERAYEHLSRTLNHEFTRRIPLILYASHADFQQTNVTPGMIDIGTGGITELVRRRVFLPFNGSLAEFEHVLTHELVHAFELDMLLDSELGDPMNPFGDAPPLWVMEGLAEFLSRDLSDAHTAMWLRDGALSGYLLSLPQLSAVYDIRVYRFGQAVFQYFAAQYGTDKIGNLLRAFHRTHDMDEAFRDVTGLNLEQFSERWLTHVRRTHLPEIGIHKLTSEFATALVTRDTEGAGMLLVPSLSPDGSRLAYVSDAGLTRDLFLRDLKTNRRRRVVRGDMSADFESLRFFNASAAWSPDGTTLAFAAKAGGADALYLLNAASARIVAKLEFGLDEVQTPTFSPDGQEIIFVGLSGGASDLYRVRRDGSGLQQLTRDRYSARDPQWSPNGRSIVYVSDEGLDTHLAQHVYGPERLILLDLATGERCDMTPFEDGKAASPVWSGDGEYVAFISDRDGISNIYLSHLATGQVFRLTNTLTGVSGVLPSSPALSWARQTNRIVFSAFSNAGWDLYAIDDPQSKMVPVEMEPGVVRAAVASETASVTVSASVASAQHAAHAVTAAAGLDDSLRTTLFVERDYKVRLSPDLSNLGGVVGYDAGIGGQSTLHFSDLLGDHTLSVGFGIYGSLRDSDLLLGYVNRARRTNYMLSAFQYRRRYGFLGDREVDVENQTYRGTQVGVLRPFDKFARLEGSLRLVGVGGRLFLRQTESEVVPGGDDVKVFVGPGMAYVHDTAVFGITGPILGRRARLAVEAGVGEIDFATFEADVRRYWNIKHHYTLAARALGASGIGGTPQTFYLGGGQTLRGYDYGALVGNHALLASLEFRFPLVRHLSLGWPLPLELANVRGALFADAGSAWDGEFLRTSRALAGGAVGRGPQVSLGAGGRINLGAFVVKLDWARRYDTTSGAVSRGANVTLGSDF